MIIDAIAFVVICIIGVFIAICVLGGLAIMAMGIMAVLTAIASLFIKR